MNIQVPDTMQANQPLLFEIIRSFVTLARTLNLSHAVSELGSTRQTVRRHIAQLEEIKGGALFKLEDRHYRLTPLGEKLLPEARDLFARGQGWLNGTAHTINGLQYVSSCTGEGPPLVQQQHPIGEIFRSNNDLLRRALQAWAMSGGELEHDAMAEIRPHIMVFRRQDNNWLCVELGDECSYVSWFGWAKARSSIGRPLAVMPGGEGFGHLVNLAYMEVEASQGARLDHIYTVFPREPDGPPVPLAYERLLTGARFPDESFALVSVLRRTYDLKIAGVTDDMIRQMPEDMLM